MARGVEARIARSSRGGGGVQFRRANTEDGLSIAEFDSFGPTRRTLRQFIAACSDLNAIVRDVLLPNPDTA